MQNSAIVLAAVPSTCIYPVLSCNGMHQYGILTSFSSCRQILW